MLYFLGVKRIIFLIYLVFVGKGKDEECESRGLENVNDFRNLLISLFGCFRNWVLEKFYDLFRFISDLMVDLGLEFFNLWFNI